MSKYGYIGPDSATPTQTQAQNHGVFKPNDVIDLIGQGKYALQEFSLQYLVVAGGASGGSGSGSDSGGGGASGYSNGTVTITSAQQGGNNSSFAFAQIRLLT